MRVVTMSPLAYWAGWACWAALVGAAGLLLARLFLVQPVIEAILEHMRPR